jgi:hypothetical protein
VRAATDKEMSLKELAQEPAGVYLYLDNQLDREYLHAVFKPYLRQKKYSEYYKKQAIVIAEAANLIEELHNVYPLIIVCSDHVDLDYYLKQRPRFTLEEWITLLIRTMGYDEEKYTHRQKQLMLTRLIPLVEPSINLLELAPTH